MPSVVGRLATGDMFESMEQDNYYQPLHDMIGPNDNQNDMTKQTGTAVLTLDCPSTLRYNYSESLDQVRWMTYSFVRKSVEEKRECGRRRRELDQDVAELMERSHEMKAELGLRQEKVGASGSLFASSYSFECQFCYDLGLHLRGHGQKPMSIFAP